MRYLLTLLSLLFLSACQTGPKIQSFSSPNKGRQILTLNKDTRGGSTKGAAITHSLKPSEYFSKIKSAKSKKEKDRLAILSQTGEFQVHFEFIETIPFTKANKNKPYYSWSTEYVFPIENKDNFISLQHILVMKVEGESEPRVVKHWRQDWTYQDSTILEYQGYKTWEKKNLKKEEIKGTWSQAVYQVDDSPRYKTLGIWSHSPNLSRWTSRTTNRPLPRREYTVRSDYQMLTGINTVTVTPTSWYHEQDNFKTVIDPKTLKPLKHLAKEIGLNRYERIKDFDFSEGKKYWASTKDYWASVRQEWNKVISNKKKIKIKSENYGKKLYQLHFDFAQKIIDNQDKVSLQGYRKHARSTINSFLSQ